VARAGPPALGLSERRRRLQRRAPKMAAPEPQAPCG
jgi:hypothetical protein